MPKYSFRQRAGRFAKKVVRKGVRYAKKRYVNKKGNFRLTRLVKDVAMVKKLINVEKKRVVGVYNTQVGQVNGNGGGAILVDITPSISQGQTAQTRNGNSVKLTGMYFSGQFFQQSSTTDMGELSIEIWKHKNKEVPMSLASTGAEIYRNHHFSGQIDLQSQRNQDYFSDYVCIRKQQIRIPADQFSGTTRVKNFSMALKLNHHLRWDDIGTLVNGQLFMLIRSKNGNASTTTANTSSLSIAPTAANTGWNYAHEHISYYVDN